MDSSEKVSEYIGECKEMGIKILVPDVNYSGAYFTVDKDDIRFGLAAVKNVGRALTENISKERQLNGLFTSFEDFCSRMMDYDLNKRTVENLIKCGAFDCFGHRRSQLNAVSYEVIDSLSKDKKNNISGQVDLFCTLDAENAPKLDMPNLP